MVAIVRGGRREADNFVAYIAFVTIAFGVHTSMRRIGGPRRLHFDKRRIGAIIIEPRTRRILIIVATACVTVPVTLWYWERALTCLDRARFLWLWLGKRFYRWMWRSRKKSLLRLRLHSINWSLEGRVSGGEGARPLFRKRGHWTMRPRIAQLKTSFSSLDI